MATPLEPPGGTVTIEGREWAVRRWRIREAGELSPGDDGGRPTRCPVLHGAIDAIDLATGERRTIEFALR